MKSVFLLLLYFRVFSFRLLDIIWWLKFWQVCCAPFSGAARQTAGRLGRRRCSWRAMSFVAEILDQVCWILLLFFGSVPRLNGDFRTRRFYRELLHWVGTEWEDVSLILLFSYCRNGEMRGEMLSKMPMCLWIWSIWTRLASHLNFIE